MRNKYSIPRDTFVFLYLGRINKDKGIDDLINVFNRIDKRLNFMLIFVGSVEEKYFYKFKNQKNILHWITKNLNNGFHFQIFYVCLVIEKDLVQ